MAPDDRTAQFRELRSAAAGWIDLQFAHIEAEAPDLVRADRLGSDYGTFSGTPRQQLAPGRTAGYQPLEFSGALPPVAVSEFAAYAPQRHEHAVAVMIELKYYDNRKTATRPHRLPKRLRPKFW
jgi:hypothetical protein